MVAEPAESPFHRRTFDREGIIERLDVIRRVGEAAAQYP